MNIILPVYGIIGALFGFVTLLGINSIMSRDRHEMTGKDKTTVDLLSGSKGRSLAVFVILLVVTLWPVFVAIYAARGEEDAS